MSSKKSLDDIGEVFFHGNERADRFIRTLPDDVEITRFHDFIDKNQSKILKIFKLFQYFWSNDCIFITDVPYRLPLAAIAHLADIPIIIRLRGSMWGEDADYHRQYPFYKRIPATVRAETSLKGVLALSDGVITVSHFHKAQVLYEHISTPPPLVKSVYEPYDPAFCDDPESDLFRKQLDIPNDANLILSVTNFVWMMKFYGLVDFSKGVNQKLIEDSNTHLVIAGDGQFFEEGKELIENSFSESVQNQLHFPGYVSNIQEAYASSDILLHLSYRDTMGMDILEGLLFGLPVVTNTAGGMPELVEGAHEDGHYIVKTDEDVAKAIESALNIADNTEITEQNKKWVKDRFNPGRISENMTAAINEILEASSDGSSLVPYMNPQY